MSAVGMILPRITVVSVRPYDWMVAGVARRALVMWADSDWYGVEFADGSRRVVRRSVVEFVRYIEDGEDWSDRWA